jgi:hypothetical protein
MDERLHVRVSRAGFRTKIGANNRVFERVMQGGEGGALARRVFILKVAEVVQMS